jgi:hypothetical protein
MHFQLRKDELTFSNSMLKVGLLRMPLASQYVPATQAACMWQMLSTMKELL